MSSFLDHFFMTNYNEYTFTIEPRNPWTEITIAMIAELPFESFVENEFGFQAYIPKELDDEQAVNAIIETISDAKIQYIRQEIEQQNWNAEWEKNFDPIRVNDQCIIRADFHPTEENYPYEIIITPKMSFGTGHHETTHMMVEYILENNFLGKDILDMGCGTSILAILAMKKGANFAEAIDIDEWAVENSLENAKKNLVSIDAKMGDSSLLGRKHFDAIFANINKNILIKDMPKYSEVLEKDGDLYLSGLLDIDFDDILATCTENGLKFVTKKERNNWIALHFIKK